MNTTTLVAEFLLIGFLAFLVLLFGILAAVDVANTATLSSLKDFPILAGFGVTLVSYLLGALIFSLSQFVNTRQIPLFLRLPVIGKHLPLRGKTTELDWPSEYLRVLQFGSVELIRELRSGESLSRIFKSTALLSPLLACTLGFWIEKSLGRLPALIAVGGCALLFLAASSSWVRQHKRNFRTIQYASRLVGSSNWTEEGGLATQEASASSDQSGGAQQSIGDGLAQ